MVNSDTEPQTLQIDTIKEGVARVLVRWDIQQVQKVDPMTEQIRTSWEYQEKVIPWILDKPYPTTQDVIDDLNAREVEILGYAQASKMTYGYGEE